MLKLLNKLFASSRNTWTQGQKEALVELLLLGVYADNILTAAEEEFLNGGEAQWQWDSGVSLPCFLQAAIAKIRSVRLDPYARQEILRDIGMRLGSREAKRRAIDELGLLLCIDGTERVEQHFFEEVESVLLPLS